MIVSANLLNESRAGVVMVAPTTTTARGLPSHIELDPADSGLDRISYAKCENVRSISERRLIARLGIVGEPAMFEIVRSLRFLLDL